MRVAKAMGDIMLLYISQPSAVQGAGFPDGADGRGLPNAARRTWAHRRHGAPVCRGAQQHVGGSNGHMNQSYE